MSLFKNRQEAGQYLARILKEYAKNPDVIVLALPRGGVPIAFEISKALQLPLDLLLVRKLGTPGHEELAMGAIAIEDTCIFNEEILKALHPSQQMIDQILEKEKEELKRRNKCYRKGLPMLNLRNKTIIVVDDGIATGYTMKAALFALQQSAPAHVILAVPVAPKESLILLSPFADEVICPYTPEPFCAVGVWYEDFPQVEDDEVLFLLQEANEHHALSAASTASTS